MDEKHYSEMVLCWNNLISEIDIYKRKIFLFGHCNATLQLIDFLDSNNIKIAGILDNSDSKQSVEYKGVHVYYPKDIIELSGMKPKENSIVLITSRFYASMLEQLRNLGYEGPVRKIIDYNTYADYSLSEDTLRRMKKREYEGEIFIKSLEKKYPGYFKVYFPFEALGDIYFAMSYWEAFAKKREIGYVVFCVTSKALKDVICMFGNYIIEVYKQKKLDAMIQASLYMHDENSFIVHQDRPYVINLSAALYVKKIPLEQIYCCGIYGLPQNTIPMIPCTNGKIYKDIDSIPKDKSVIFSPYAKSVTLINMEVWESAVNYYSMKGYTCYTNVVGDEFPLEGTKAISPSILELKSVVEKAGTFIGIRSGLCDVLREVKAKKIALYPDYNYCDTQWKAIEMYWIRQFDYNLLATEVIEWEKL